MNCTCKVLRYFQFPVVFRGIQAQTYSSSNDDINEPGTPKVALTKDNKTIVMYHPPESLSYEKTVSIPRDDSRYCFNNVESLVRKRLHEKDIASRAVEFPSIPHMFPMHDRDVLPTAIELSALFHTSRHRWFRKDRKKIRLFKIPQ